MENLIALLVLMLVFMCWWHQRGIKDRALRQAQLRCAQLGLQLLDETVQLAAMWPLRDEAGNWVWRRRYGFEFTSTGEVRYAGELTLVGLRLVSFELPPYAMPAPEEEVSITPPSERLH